MCPNHVEQYIDSKLVTSTRLSERLALWQKYARAPINMETVRMEFFRKVRTGKLFQKSKTLKAQRPENMRIKVPPYIKKLYKNPTSGFPLEHQPSIGNLKFSCLFTFQFEIQLFVYIPIWNSAVCLHFNLKFSCLFTYELLMSAVCLHL